MNPKSSETPCRKQLYAYPTSTYTRYPEVHAELVEKKYGLSILLTIHESEDNVKVFLSRRYSVVLMEEDLADINGQTLQCYLTRKRVSRPTRTFYKLICDVRSLLQIANLLLRGLVFDGTRR